MDNYHILTYRRDISITEFLRSIKNMNHIRILEMSSPFNYDKSKMLEFLESIVSGRPFHIVLAQSGKRLNSRSFEINCNLNNVQYTCTDKVAPNYYYVLDGFQRLQCLYTAFFGHFDGERIFYDTTYIEEAGGERFLFSKRKCSTRSMIRLNLVKDRARKTHLPSNWMFDSIMKNLSDFCKYFHDNKTLDLTIIDVRSSESESNPWYVKPETLLHHFRNKMDLFIDLLNSPEEEVVFYQIGTRLRDFIDLMDREESEA